MGMKFHKLYVGVLNPLGIVLIALIAVLMLLISLNTGFITEEMDIPYLSALETGAVLWTLFGLAAAMLLFMLITEVLLVRQKKTGIIMLSISLILGMVSTIVSYIRYEAATPWYAIAVSLVISALILIYYWKRYSDFS